MIFIPMLLAKGILLSPPSVCPSVCPLCYLLLYHWTKFNQIWCLSYWHEWGLQHQTFFGPAPWGPQEGSKGQISFNFNYKFNFKDFFYQTLCVISQMKATKHIRRDFHSVPLVMPQKFNDIWPLTSPQGHQFDPRMKILLAFCSARHPRRFDIPYDHVWKKNFFWPLGTPSIPKVPPLGHDPGDWIKIPSDMFFIFHLWEHTQSLV